MKGRAFIEELRRAQTMERALLADAVEEADASFIKAVSLYSPKTIDGVPSGAWFACVNPFEQERFTHCVSYLDRRGLIERKSGETHLIRFVEET